MKKGEKLKVLFACDSAPPHPDGVSTFIREVVSRASKELEVTLAVPEFAKLWRGVKAVKLPLLKESFFQSLVGFTPAKPCFKKVSRLVEENDVVFTQLLLTIGFSAALAGWLKGKKLVAYIHSVEWDNYSKGVTSGLLQGWLRGFLKRLYRFAYNRFDCLIVPSKGVAELLSANKVSTKKEVVHLGVDRSRFKPDPSVRRMVRKKLGLSEEHFLIGYHGRLSREKDLKTLLRAFSRVRRKFPEARLLIIGKGLKSLEEEVKRVRGVILKKPVSKVEDYLKAMDAYCLTSLTETTSLSTLEAMSTGLAVVATRVGLVKDYVVNGVNGFLVRKENAVELARVLEKLATSPELRRVVGREARKSVKDFDWDASAKRVVEVLRRVRETEKVEEDSGTA